MSEWRKIKVPDDVALSEDGTTLDVLIDHHEGFGNVYIEIPIEFVVRALSGRKTE